MVSGFAGKVLERNHLVCRVHGDADDILRQRQFADDMAIGGNEAGHGMVGVEDAVLDQHLHGLEAAAASDHGIALGAIAVRFVGTDHQVLEQSEGGDRGLELGIGLLIGRRLADVFGGERQPAQRDFPDERFGPGGDVVHASLHGGLHRRGGDGALRPPCACPPRSAGSASTRSERDRRGRDRSVGADAVEGVRVVVCGVDVEEVTLGRRRRTRGNGQ